MGLSKKEPGIAMDSHGFCRSMLVKFMMNKWFWMDLEPQGDGHGPGIQRDPRVDPLL